MSEQEMMDGLVQSIQAYVLKMVGEAESKADARIAAVEAEFAKRIEELPKPTNGVDGKNGEPGEKGKDADPVDMPAILKTIDDTIAARVAEIPKPENGKDGERGKDADPVDYERITKELFTHAESCVALIPKPKDGIDGKDGKDADPQKAAELVMAKCGDMLREQIASIPLPRDGIDGQDGQDGKDGERGENGRDAPEMEFLSNVDPAKTYRRGTFAKFDGSIWRSNGNGWDCMVAGIGAITGRFEDRKLTLDIETGGEVKQISIVVPMMLYRGAHQLGKEYDPGDVVNSDGSGWIAEVATSDIPGASPDWKLIAKKGRDFRPMDRTVPRDGPVLLR